MIKLVDVGKTYFNKNKQVEALKNINLELLNAGMVFILGKSGSGKSTLLNILGGIDQATTGEVVIDGVSQKEFKEKDYADYRNHYVGFIFQEFNLLHDLNVYENIALALQLSDKENVEERVANALEQVDLSSEYFTRKIDELSGGEKQRIAIARTIVKDCNVILADEPTGNLDSKTGETIWKILKKQAESKLVIVVSHDRESADKYADRVIEISDGQIISDRGKEKTTETKKTIREKRNALSGKVALKMAFNNLLKRKVRSISVVVMAILSIFALKLTQMCLSYSSEKALARFIDNNDISYFSVKQGTENDDCFSRGGVFVRQDTLQYLENKSAYIKNGCVDSHQHMLDFGFSFIGESLELTETSYYVPDFILEKSYESPKSFVMIDGEKVKMVKELHSLEFLIGKQVNLGELNSTDYILAGVVDTTDMNQLSRESLPSCFCLQSFLGKRTKTSKYNSQPENKDVIFEYGDRKFDGEFAVDDHLLAAVGTFNGRILTKYGLQKYTDVVLSEGEIVLSYELYQSLFSAKSKWYYVDPDLTEIVNVPAELGQMFSLRFYEYTSKGVILNLGKYKIAGIAFSEQNYTIPSENYTMVFDSHTYRVIAQALSQNNSILIKTNSVKNLSSFLTTLRKEYHGYVYDVGRDVDTGSHFADIAYDFETEITTFKQIFTLLSIVLMIVLLLFVVNLITFSIHDRSKEIGILSALGTRNKDIVKIFIYETLFISMTSFFLDTLLSFVAASFFNAEYCKIYSLILPLFAVDWFTILGLFVVSFGLLLLFAWIPVRKIAKMKPIEAIKSC
mgnify:CR=1 FL=1